MERQNAITVVGAGGIGGVIAGFLALAGSRVTVVDKSPEHVAVMREHGLLVDGVRGEHRVRFDRVLSPQELEGPLGLVLLAVKSQHTADAMSTIAPLLAPDGVVVSLQNGFNPKVVARAVGLDRTVGTMVHMAADYVGPGHVHRAEQGEFYVGRLDGLITPNLQEVARSLGPAIDTHPTDNIWGQIWTKLIYGACFVAEALVDAPAVETYKPEWARRVFLGLMLEVKAAAEAEGARLMPYHRLNPMDLDISDAKDLPKAMDAVPKGSSKGHSGIWLDIHVRYRKSEVDYLTGDIARIGQSHGLPMALNAKVTQMVQEIENGQRVMSWENLRTLEADAAAILQF